jgi:hypothetical protein
MNALQRHIALNQLDEADTMNALQEGCLACPDVAVWAADVGAESATSCVAWLSKTEGSHLI